MNLCVLFIARTAGGRYLPNEFRRFPVSDNNYLEFLQKMPKITLHLPPARLAHVARVGLSQQRSPVWRYSHTGFFVSGVRYAA